MILQNTTAWILHAPGIPAIIPGANDVSDDAWRKAKSNPVISGWVESGWIKEQEAQSLAGLKANEAIALVKDTFSMELLGKWLEEEQRKTVIEAIEAQMKELERKPEKAGE